MMDEQDDCYHRFSHTLDDLADEAAARALITARRNTRREQLIQGLFSRYDDGQELVAEGKVTEHEVLRLLGCQIATIREHDRAYSPTTGTAHVEPMTETAESDSETYHNYSRAAR